jgi:hypothetical protein
MLLPQEPQLCASFCSFTHVPLQFVSPVGDAPSPVELRVVAAA